MAWKKIKDRFVCPCTGRWTRHRLSRFSWNRCPFAARLHWPCGAVVVRRILGGRPCLLRWCCWRCCVRSAPCRVDCPLALLPPLCPIIPKGLFLGFAMPACAPDGIGPPIDRASSSLLSFDRLGKVTHWRDLRCDENELLAFMVVEWDCGLSHSFGKAMKHEEIPVRKLWAYLRFLSILCLLDCAISWLIVPAVLVMPNPSSLRCFKGLLLKPSFSTFSFVSNWLKIVRKISWKLSIFLFCLGKAWPI